MKNRVICHFSCGASSAVATKLALDKYGKENCIIYNIYLKEEHDDNQRFIKECEKWYGKEIITIKNEKFNGSIYEVFKLGYIKGIHGASCTTQLKRKVRETIQQPNDIHIFGFNFEEQQRAIDFEERNPNLNVDWVLIEERLTKNNCLGILNNANIDIPTMYKLGYKNNNCIGCVKGGMGYWNKIRQDFPETFNRMARVERELNHSLLKDKNGLLFLDELEPNRGRYNDEPDIECTFVCKSIF